MAFILCPVTDWQKLQKISIETFSDTFASQNDPQDLEDYLATAYHEDQLKRELLNPESQFFFFCQEEEVVGYLKINEGTAQTERVGEHALEVERIYIRKDYQGLGYGKQLLQAAEEIALKKEKALIWLGVWEKNYRAQAFYEEMGFTYHSSHVFYMGEDPQRDLILIKKIDGGNEDAESCC